MPQVSAKFVKDRETKGAIRYQEVDEEGEMTINLAGTQYLRKSALRKPYPDYVTITVSYDEDSVS